jgi:hypothetical protein
MDEKVAEAGNGACRSIIPCLIIYATILSLVFTPLVFAAGPDFPFLLILLIICVLLLVAGYIVCSGYQAEPARDTVIVVSIGWCGGMGEAVLEPPEYTSVHYFKGLPVFISDTRIRIFAESITGNGGPLKRIQVKGLIRLVRKTGFNPSVPGRSLQSYWSAEIGRLDQIQVWDESMAGLHGTEKEN